MSKSKDLKEAAVKYYMSGHKLVETAEIFRVSKSAVSSWVKQYKETGDLSNKPLNRGFKKIDPEKLIEYVQKHPDATQKEMSEYFRACSHKKSIKNHCKHNYRQKNRVQLIIASTNLSKTFDSEEKTFHLVSLFI